MSWPCPRCGVPAPVVVSSAGALPPELVMADEVSRLREALENAADDGHHAMCRTMLLYRGCTCHQAATLKALGMACPACDGEGAVLSADRVRMHCGACDASGRAALATAKAKGG